jgi:hypothetical protein
MLVSAQFAGWIVDGTDPEGGPTDVRSQSERFAEHERTVMSRTNGWRAADGRLNLPWPHAVGTPPWGAKKELESSQLGMTGADYTMRVLGLGSATALREAHRILVGLVREGLPALLYVGNTWMPRHVTLVLPGDRQGAGGSKDVGVLDVYDPATGSVTGLDPDRFATRKLAIAGWNVPWITVQPRPR